MFTSGSLFSGVGGWDRAVEMCGGKTLWFSEIEPYPIAVFHSHFPEAKWVGDISKVDVESLESVDVITFSSPCQNLSIAGNGTGLNGAESGLFHEAIRVVKEMRAKYGKPRFVIWENVTGAFSSNKGEDFRVVIEELCRIKDPEISIPKPDKWQQAGCVLGDGYSIAWRTFDAQYWGVAQRRKRIYLVADFGGDCAGEVLFERKGLSRDFKTGKRAEQDSTRSSTNCVGETSTGIGIDGYNFAITGDVSSTLGVNCGMSTGRNGVICCSVENYGNDSRIRIREDGSVQTLTSRMGTGGNNTPMALCVGNGQLHSVDPEPIAKTLNTMHDQQAIIEAGRIRRLTPVECARLQGMPDDWGNLKEFNPEDNELWNSVRGDNYTIEQNMKWYNRLHSNSAEYKAWGNGLAFPPTLYVIEGIEEQYI